MLEACDNGEGDGEVATQGIQPVTTMRLSSPDSSWESHRDGVPEILTMEQGGPGPVQAHSYNISPYQPPSINYAVSPPMTDGPPALSLREASLMRNFIQQIAPWVSGILFGLQNVVP